MLLNHKLKLYYRLALLLAAFSLPACAAKVDTGGYVRDGDVKEHIRVGQSTREDVRSQLGSPSAQSTYGQETWYYISNRKEATAFFKPEVVEQDVTRIEFDTAGVVSNIQHFDETNGQELEIVSRTTPTEGHSLGFFEQILGNVGRFNTERDTLAPGRRPGR